MDPFFESFNWGDQETYINWLASTYEYAVQSTRILALTAGFFPKTMTAYSNRFIAHAAEEKNHDKLIESDAKSFGIDISQLKPSPVAEAFHKSLYYWIFNGQPLAIFGWILALEGIAVRHGKPAYAKAEKAFGKKGTLFLKVHAEEDEDHLTKAFESISELKSDELEQVAQGFDLYLSLYQQMLETAQSHSGLRSNAA